MPGKVQARGLEKTIFPLAFLQHSKQLHAPCFWAWLREVNPPDGGGELVGGNMRQHGLGVWGLRASLGLLGMRFATGREALPQSRLVTLFCVMRGGTQWPSRFGSGLL